MEFASKLMERTGKGYVSYSALKYAADGSRQQDMKLFELYMRGLLKKKSDALYFFLLTGSELPVALPVEAAFTDSERLFVLTGCSVWTLLRFHSLSNL